MPDTIRDLMTVNPLILDASCNVIDAAREMRDRDIGDVLVANDGSLCGIVTDRDLVVRCLAEGGDPSQTTLKDLCSSKLAMLQSDASIDEAVELMKERAVRRVPVVEGDTAVGIVSLGDLAELRDPQSALGRISAASAQA